MKCNWCGEGDGKNHTKCKKTGAIYFYYCSNCVGFIGEEINPAVKKYLYEYKSDSIGLAEIIKDVRNKEKDNLIGKLDKLRPLIPYSYEPLNEIIKELEEESCQKQN